MAAKTLKALRDELLATASLAFDQGAGFFQQSVILKETARRLRIDNAGVEACELLTAWHGLFEEGLFSPGCDLDNPSLPFLHLTSKGRKALKKKTIDPGR
jgi:hypothetical protein